ncbi:MAG: class I SAM-dependent methyltransferase [Rhodospirillaceae bacterium]
MEYDDIIDLIASNDPTLPLILHEMWRGKSLTRTLVNARLKNIELPKKVLDLGARDKLSSYYRFFSHQNANVTFTDIDPKDQGMIHVDLEQSLPFYDQSYDALLLMFVLNYIWEAGPLLTEMRRVTRGWAIIATSFVEQWNPEPYDWHRFTGQGLERLALEAGWRQARVFSIGLGPFTLALTALQQSAFASRPAAVVFPLVWAADALCTLLAHKRIANKCTVAHLLVLDGR